MSENEMASHRFTMICPECDEAFRLQDVGLHVRLCPECETKKSKYVKKLPGDFNGITQQGGKVIQALLGIA